MKKFIMLLKGAKTALHIGSVIIGTIVSALTVTSLGGDPVLGASVGGATTAGINLVSSMIS